MEAPVPQRIADDGFVLMARLLFFVEKRSAKLRLYAEHGEQVRGNAGPVELFGLAGASEHEVRRLDDTELLEGGAVVAPLEEMAVTIAACEGGTDWRRRPGNVEIQDARP